MSEMRFAHKNEAFAEAARIAGELRPIGFRTVVHEDHCVGMTGNFIVTIIGTNRPGPDESCVSCGCKHPSAECTRNASTTCGSQ